MTRLSRERIQATAEAAATLRTQGWRVASMGAAHLPILATKNGKLLGVVVRRVTRAAPGKGWSKGPSMGVLSRQYPMLDKIERTSFHVPNPQDPVSAQEARLHEEQRAIARLRAQGWYVLHVAGQAPDAVAAKVGCIAAVEVILYRGEPLKRLHREAAVKRASYNAFDQVFVFARRPDGTIWLIEPEIAAGTGTVGPVSSYA